MAKITELPKYFSIALITCYSIFISRFFGPNCRYHPTCSTYTKTAIKRYGFFIGIWLGCRRLLRCHPWHEGGYDPVPNKH